ncbi:MAG: adenylate/guanylate cyclase domain-containing protein, partial [Pseudomonadota bacterium]
VRRSNNLLLAQAAVERERANLARYFSPNVVDQLSTNDEPLKQVVEQEIAVLFVDIIGFTTYASAREPRDVIQTLREFHGRMEREVFRHDGTLDKYLGDGLMATFGTPFAGDTDALNALRCASAMAASVDKWNAERAEKGLEKIKAGFGIHAGPVVLGDIGANRLEFAVIGNTVNVASRLESLTRQLDGRIVASDDLMARAYSQSSRDDKIYGGMTKVTGQEIRGVEGEMTVWTAA